MVFPADYSAASATGVWVSTHDKVCVPGPQRYLDEPVKRYKPSFTFTYGGNHA